MQSIITLIIIALVVGFFNAVTKKAQKQAPTQTKLPADPWSGLNTGNSSMSSSEQETKFSASLHFEGDKKIQGPPAFLGGEEHKLTEISDMPDEAEVAEKKRKQIALPNGGLRAAVIWSEILNRKF